MQLVEQHNTQPAGSLQLIVVRSLSRKGVALCFFEPSTEKIRIGTQRCMRALRIRSHHLAGYIKDTFKYSDYFRIERLDRY